VRVAIALPRNPCSPSSHAFTSLLLWGAIFVQEEKGMPKVPLGLLEEF